MDYCTADFNSNSRPLESSFYAGTPSYYNFKFKLYSILDESGKDGAFYTISSSLIEPIEKSSFEQVIGENISDQMV